MNEWNESNLVNYYYKRTHTALGITCTLNTYAQGHSHILLLFTEKKNASCPLNALSKMDYPSLLFFLFFCAEFHRSRVSSCHSEIGNFSSRKLSSHQHMSSHPPFSTLICISPPPPPLPPVIHGEVTLTHEKELSVSEASRQPPGGT